MEHVIIGNSAAGLSAAATLCQSKPNAKISIVSDEIHPAYLRCMLTEIVEGKKDLKGIGYHVPAVHASKNLTLHLGVRAEKILLDEKRVCVSDGNTIPYDRLLVATGAIHHSLGIDNESIEGVSPFRTYDQAAGIARMAGKNKHAVVIGAGLTGLRVAQTLNRMGLKVTVVDQASRLLESQLDRESARLIENELYRYGIRFMFDCAPESFLTASYGDVLAGVGLDTGKELKADLAVIGAGVRARSGLVENAGGDTDLGIRVDGHLKTSLPDVYAAGDCVEFRQPGAVSRSFLSALWPFAVEQGRVAALNMLGFDRTYPVPLEKLNATQFGDIPIVSAGKMEGWDDNPVYRDRNGTYRRLFLKDGCLTGYVLMGDIDRAGIYTEAIKRKLPLNGLQKKLLKGNITICDIMNLK